MKLYLYILLLCPFIGSAQSIHKKDLLGKWYIQRMVQNGNVLIDRTNEAAGLQTALISMKAGNPGYTAGDSTAVANDYHEKTKMMDKIFIEFYEDGRLEMTNFGGGGQTIEDKPNIGTYTFNEKTDTLTTIDSTSQDQFATTIENNNLKMTIEVAGLKMEMQWRKK